MRTTIAIRREESLKANGKDFANASPNIRCCSVKIQFTERQKSCRSAKTSKPASGLADHLEREGIFIGDFFEPLKTPGGTGMTGSHVDLEQDRCIAG